MIDYFRAVVARLLGLFRDRRADQELDDEIETHMRLLTERYLRQGLSDAEAVWAARRQWRSQAVCSTIPAATSEM
jgi:hypothetical protein